MNMKKRIAAVRARLALYDAFDVTPLANIVHNRLVRAIGILVLLIIAISIPVAGILLMAGLMLGSVEVLSSGQGLVGISGIWIIIQACSVDGLLCASILMVLIEKGLWRIPYLIILGLLFLTAGFIASVYLQSLLTHTSVEISIADMGISTYVFAWVRGFLTVFIATVDVVYIAIGYNKTFGLHLPGLFQENFVAWLAGIFEELRIKRSVRVQKSLSQTATISAPPKNVKQLNKPAVSPTGRKQYRSKEEIAQIGAYARQHHKFPEGLSRDDKRNYRRRFNLPNDVR